MKMKLSPLAVSFVLLGLFALVVCGYSTQTAKADTSNASDTAQTVLMLDDGPHVLWQNDTTAIVYYYCDSEMVSQVYSVEDTLRFMGRCGDTWIPYIIPPRMDEPPTNEIDGVSRWIAVSDIHGEYEPLIEILINAGVTDEALHWSWGEGHLVINGDITDRGAGVTECLWLIYHLEQEASTAGGAVHYILGNHELMVIKGDLRYVHERYTKGIARRNRTPYDDLFGPDMELGRWMRSKQALLRINKTLFVHGGVSPTVAQSGYDIATLNDAVRRGLGYSSPRAYFSDTTKLLFGGLGPMWYRGYMMDMEGSYQEQTNEQIDSQLTYFDVQNIVVGHSQVDSISTFHDGRIIAIDVRVDKLGGQQALLWQDSKFYRVDAAGKRQLLQ